MGKKVKVGKARRDKYYQLAKETGYRSRASYKLLQLNKKFEFLQNARVCLDLCAAPGGWLQVAAQQMGVSSVIIGVDLVPIKPLHNVTTFQEDITTDKCRQIIRKQLQTWKADVVLHDGAPNLGKNWLHDSFQQAQLTLQALKLATQFLRKGGWFVTKVFRCKDYNALLWVFTQLFKKVHPIKPHASRNESAEIFVVCKRYLAPDKLDPKFLDPKFVFGEVPDEQGVRKDVYHPEKQSKRAEGYAEGNYTLQQRLPVTEFFKVENFWQLLADATEIIFDDETIANHPLTTLEIRECCKDLKVLGTKDLRNLVSWRKKMKVILEAKDPKEVEEAMDMTGDVAEKSDDDETEEVNKQIEQIQEEQKKDMKKKRKKVMKEKRKLRDKMSLNMVIPGDQIETNDDMEMFSLKQLKNVKDVETVDSAEMPEDSENELDDSDADGKNKKRMTTYDRHDDDDDDDDDEEDDDNDDEEEESDEDVDVQKTTKAVVEQAKAGGNPLLRNLQKNDNRTELWFKKDVFADIENDELESSDSKPESKKPKKRKNIETDDDDDDDDYYNEVGMEKKTDRKKKKVPTATLR